MTEQSRLRIADLAAESFAGLLQRPARSVLTMLGTVLGVAAFVAVLGLTATAGGQIDKRFTELAATEVTIQDVGAAGDPQAAISFPNDAAARVQALNGVTHAGLWWHVPLREPSISAAPGVTTDSTGLSINALDPSALAAVHPRLSQGRLFDNFHQDRGEPVAILGSAAAARLGITRLDGFPAVFIDSTPYVVLGIITETDRMPELLFSIIMPTSTALASYGPPIGKRANMLIETRLGAAQLVATQAPLALRPDAPQLFQAISPPDPQTLRSNVTADMNILFVLLAAVSLVIGAFGIANTTLVAVLERTAEIGMRRSLGARPAHIAAQFLTESTTLGLLGGLTGATLGTSTVIAVTITQQWTALLQPWTILLAPAIGAIIGLAAGTYPALRAARIEPVEALRR